MAVERHEVRLTILVENTAAGRGMLGEHGWSVWIELPGGRVLLDTGQGAVLPSNVARLGVDVGTADAVVLSHGHYDHVGGLEWVLARTGRDAKIYAHPAAFGPHWACNADGTGRDIGFSSLGCGEAYERAVESRCVSTTGPTEVVPGLWATGAVPRVTGFEDTGGPFYTDRACREPDALLDDQALYFDTALGVVVVLGCAHAGVVNTLRHVQALTDGRAMHAVIGGMHLSGATSERVQATMDAFADLGVERLYPAHCTGLDAFTAFRERFGVERCKPCPAGTAMAFPL